MTDEQLEKNRQHLHKIITDTYNRGGVVTAAWHFLNPVSPGGFYCVDSVSRPAVKYIIPGGSYHEQYKKILQSIASLALSLKGNDGKLVPVIFRPYHELDGYWFWWGKNSVRWMNSNRFGALLVLTCGIVCMCTISFIHFLLIALLTGKKNMQYVSR